MEDLAPVVHVRVVAVASILLVAVEAVIIGSVKKVGGRGRQPLDGIGVLLVLGLVVLQQEEAVGDEVLEDLCGSEGGEAGQEEEVLGGRMHGDHWGLPNQRHVFYPVIGSSAVVVVADTRAFTQPLTDVWTSSPVRKSSLS